MITRPLRPGDGGVIKGLARRDALPAPCRRYDDKSVGAGLSCESGYSPMTLRNISNRRRIDERTAADLSSAGRVDDSFAAVPDHTRFGLAPRLRQNRGHSVTALTDPQQEPLAWSSMY